MSWQAWATAVVAATMLLLMATGRFATDMIIMGAMLALLLLGIITPAEAVQGFGNPEVITVGVLFIVAAGLKETGAMSVVSSRVLDHARTVRGAQARLIFPVAVASAFMNNTPLVAMFMPVLSGVARRTGIPAAKLFMPLSFAAILGGVCTLIGTSTNLVVNGRIRDYNAAHADSPIPVMGMWTLSAVGLPVAAVGLAYMLVLGKRLLPGEREASSPVDQEREYMVAMRAEASSPVVGRTIEGAGLRRLPGLFLSRIDRGSETLTAVPPDESIRPGDVLVFVGVLDSVVELQGIKGLVPATGEESPGRNRPALKLVEAVVSAASPLVGKTVREAGIRTRYNAVVIAVHRFGHRLTGRIGDIELRPGDTLLLEAARGFGSAYRNSSEFHLVSELEGAAVPRHERSWVALVILIAMVVAMSTSVVSSMVAALAAAGAMVLLRCCSGAVARASLEWPVLVIIGGAFAVGEALEKTGVASFLASQLVQVSSGLGPIGVLGAVYFASVLFTVLINNNAAAVLMFPIAVGAARAGGLNPTPFVIAVCIAASCEFSTPMGYQTNLMVMGPGGYKWPDYLRFGGPLTVLCGLVALGVIPLVFPLR